MPRPDGARPDGARPDGARPDSGWEARRIRIRVDGEVVEDSLTDLGVSLLTVLRRNGRTAPKSACGRGECGACTVLLGDRVVMSCTVLAAAVTADVTTAAGLAADDLRESFADHVAFQCGFCTPGQIVRAEALLREGSCPTRAEVTRAMAGNVCRCTGYVQIIDAIMDTMEKRRVEGSDCVPQ
ncbi:2Fe-2S iron-sulfur cluster-binding protein [Streptosporangium sp. NBC_01755]|uniref:(2Fe-2S)-binding protein n=1 Tax=Streptosporangium sp. NBC_01755 TaxID=2975949 RepID=UPI002DDB1076|nr:2Fe-2S iron-sulfur cluster-binding protein [Streptosporangium sp. NBC_01755]WSC99542.1 2Fe-2S iron-sulfur cluster-binding protein [Streptosporangium sp. NBC_01755]